MRVGHPTVCRHCLCSGESTLLEEPTYCRCCIVRDQLLIQQSTNKGKVPKAHALPKVMQVATVQAQSAVHTTALKG
jgi:hypothetical protein